MEVLQQLKEKLANGIAHFEFLKSNGETREAFGTINGEFIPKYTDSQVQALAEEARDFHTGFGTDTLIQGDDDKLAKAYAPFFPSGEAKESRAPREGVVTYYDLVKKGWRSCSIDSILKVH